LATEPEVRAKVVERCAATCESLVSALLPRILAEGSRPAVDLGLGYLTASGMDKRATLGLLSRLNVSLGLDYRQEVYVYMGPRKLPYPIPLLPYMT
jgi:hypothetical protein